MGGLLWTVLVESNDEARIGTAYYKISGTSTVFTDTIDVMEVLSQSLQQFMEELETVEFWYASKGTPFFRKKREIKTNDMSELASDATTITMVGDAPVIAEVGQVR